MNKISLSVVIITLNEARNIGSCLASVRRVADEIVIIDSFSSDETEAICIAFANENALPLRFIKHAFAGHVQQKNVALAAAKCSHILSLDADEALSEELENSILNIKNTEISKLNKGFYFNRRTSYCGNWIWHSGWYPDRKLRLVAQNTAEWRGTNPHDSLFMRQNGEKTDFLSGDLLHYSFATHEELVAQFQKFSTIAAKARFENGEKSSIFKIIYKTAFKFFRNYILKLGFLDGKNGLIICFWTAKETFWRYKKLRDFGAKNK